MEFLTWYNSQELALSTTLTFSLHPCAYGTPPPIHFTYLVGGNPYALQHRLYCWSSINWRTFWAFKIHQDQTRIYSYKNYLQHIHRRALCLDRECGGSWTHNVSDLLAFSLCLLLSFRLNGQMICTSGHLASWGEECLPQQTDLMWPI